MWPGKRANIRKMCKECHLCAVAKDYGRSGRQPLEPNKVDYLEPLQKVDLGLVGPLPKAKDGLQHLIVLQYCFSKFPVVGCLKSGEASVLTRWPCDNVLTVYGVPEEMITDCKTQLSSVEFEEFLKKNGIKHFKTAPFTPTTDGLVEPYSMVERFN